jgi:putative hydrolase of the HAD superfamily
MQFYRAFKRPQAIGFDLDDTLYDNRPVLINAEHALHTFLLANFPKTTALSIKNWMSLRTNLILKQPSLKHDVSLARLKALNAGLLASGYSQQDSKIGSERALEHFLVWRNKIVITPEIHSLLNDLSKQYTLFAISNGNADVQQLSLDKYFDFALRPSLTVPMKPAAALFQQAQHRLNLSGSTILYVGDHPVSDIVGSNNVGWQSAWFNPNKLSLNHYKKPLQLPIFEFNTIGELRYLLT